MGILLVRQAEEQLQICQELAACIEDWRDPNKITHPLAQLVSQRVYQLVGGYEDANDSDFLRHDPIFKLVCERLPVPGGELLASQPTMSRLENHVTRQEESAMRRSFIDRFIASYESAPSKVVLDIDGWDDPTHGEQEQSAFHGYYGQHMYFPVLINEAVSGFHWSCSYELAIAIPARVLLGFCAGYSGVSSEPGQMCRLLCVLMEGFLCPKS